MLNGLGVAHGIDLDALLDASHYICGAIGRENQSRVARAKGGGRRAPADQGPQAAGGGAGGPRRLEREQ